MDDVCSLVLLAKLFLGGMFLLFYGEGRATRPEEVELYSDLVLEFVQLGYACLELRFHQIKYIGLLCRITQELLIYKMEREEGRKMADVGGVGWLSFICGKIMNAGSLHILNLPYKHSYHLSILLLSPFPILFIICPCISVYNSNQMLQNRSQFQSNQEASLLSSQLKQYRKINSNLRKKIKQKDNQIQQLFGYIQDVGLAFSSNTEGYLVKGPIREQRSHKIALSDNRKREKENKASEFFQESNIFKQPSYSLMTRNSRPEVHLPVLDKKNKNIFQDQPETPDKRTKVIRISLEKLKPLNPEEVKKRFLMKYQRHEVNE